MSATHRENMINAVKKSKENKVTYNQKAVTMYDLDMNYLDEYASIQEASRKTGHNAYTICKICQGKKENVKNHIFKYK